MKDLTHLADSLQKVLKDYNLEKTYSQSKAMEIWDEVVGDRLAEVSEPIKIEFGTLIVEVSSPVWRNEIQFHLEHIKRTMNQRLGEKIVKKIVLK